MKMLPPYLGKTISNAERKIFHSISSSRELEGWYCLHSLGVSNHLYKREGEIDFLLIGESGVFTIEVKGGRVHRENGIWKFTDRYGRVTDKRESPFSQAQSAMYSIRQDIAQKYGPEANKFLFGYGVAFPDIKFTTESPEWNQNWIYDNRDTNSDFCEYLVRLITSWKSQQKNHKPLNGQTIKEIVQYLRGDFETVVPISVGIEESETELIKLTGEQISSLDAMQDNPRVIFQGAAGTGKTLIAVEQARRNASKELRTLMLCYNKYLAAYLKQAIEDEGLQEFINVKSLHSYFYEAISRAGLKQELESLNKTLPSREVYTKAYPDLFMKAWRDLEQYDSLIIDEAQDVLTDGYIAPFSKILRGGLDKGNWYMFLDPENQKNIFAKLDNEVFQKLKDVSTAFTLTVNCRNTKPIALQTEILSGISTAKVKKVEGVPVQYIWYENETEQAIKVTEAIDRILDQGVKAGDITILSPLRYSSSIAGTGKLRPKAPIYHLDTENVTAQPRDRIAYTSIQSYKGLEAPVIVITDITELDDDWNRVVNYVGLTRARTALVVSADKKLKKEYRNRLNKIFESNT
jgi:superfamily I DNA/RNA helicase